MSKIHLLHDSLIDKIAAGEVVENPRSVVKELLENSLDAQADSIDIEIVDGGISLINVTDNGVGMEAADAALAVKRHATSKISSEADLLAIKTLGFRGEALASICAVSKFSLITKTHDAKQGTMVKIERDNIVASKVASNHGTAIIVRDLFYNIPARRKFLKSVAQESAGVTELVSRYALAYPQVSFSLTVNGRRSLTTAKSGNILSAIASVYGNTLAKSLIPIQYESGEKKLSFTGYIARPDACRHDSSRQNIFINGRYVISQEIAHAIKDGYGKTIFMDLQPVFVVALQIDEETVDVNVHPRKEIVKISSMPILKEIISNAVNVALSSQSLIVEGEHITTSAKSTHNYAFSKDTQSLLSVPEEEFDDKGDRFITPGTVGSSLKEAEQIASSSKNQLSSFSSSNVINPQKLGPLKILGQVNHTYIVAENLQGLIIIDQHAAEERVNYEKLKSQKKASAIKTQKLLQPYVLELSPHEHTLVMHHLDAMHAAGFECEEHGKNTVVVRAVPFIFERPSKNMIIDLIHTLEDCGKNRQDDEVEERIIRFSCKMSIKAGESLTSIQMEKLMRDLNECEMPFTCPHGRPTIVKMSVAELERMFKRTG